MLDCRTRRGIAAYLYSYSASLTSSLVSDMSYAACVHCIAILRFVLLSGADAAGRLFHCAHLIDTYSTARQYSLVFLLQTETGCSSHLSTLIDKLLVKVVFTINLDCI